MRRGTAVGIALVVSCGRGDRAAPPPPATAAIGHDATAVTLAITPDQLLTAGPPTLIVGTLGDERSDRAVRAQAALVRSVLPAAVTVDDTSIDVTAGPAAWPANPVLLGGSQVNAVVRSLSAELPFAIDAAQLTIGGATFTDHGTALIAAVPARAPGDGGRGHPSFVIYAGTGMPGTAEINGVRHGGEPILIADGFGRLQGGAWERDARGQIVARLGRAAPRIAWRFHDRVVAGATMRVGFPAQLPPEPDEAVAADAIARGLERAAARVRITTPAAHTAYVYPDARSKQSLTGDPGHGHAVARARAIHVLRVAPLALEPLLVHEGTHALVGDDWGPAGTLLMGEGLAVWASGSYAGTSLDRLRVIVPQRPPSTQLATWRGFRALPEGVSYPLAGLIVSAAIDAVGLDAVREHLYGASADQWEAALTRAGTSVAAIDAAIGAPR